jgi:selenocysteine-specific elongation factor
VRKLILGTAGHIDHGKTALVQALTGVDTDRLKEEKERGITIELGFAELDLPDEIHFGVVDVPGHEGFVRNMVAGSTGMDVVLLVIAADEGVMPQTREHLAIVELLGVPSMVVALSKADLTDPEWLELVQEDVRDLLQGTRFAGSPLVPVSAVSGEGLGRLKEALRTVALGAAHRPRDDLARLPVDRVFTIRGTGTVVTGTLWSGTLSTGDRIRLLPGEVQARIRGLQVHGQDVPRAHAGERTAVALAGQGLDLERVVRGMNLVPDRCWEPTMMLTVRLRMVQDTPWDIRPRQRIRVHLGTAEVLARAALLDSDALHAGDEGWVQLRLEQPVVARARDRLVIRSYSPLTTIAGGEVAEPNPPRRRKAEPREMALWKTVLEGAPVEALGAALELAEWEGLAPETLSLVTGFPPAQLKQALRESQGVLEAGGRFYSEALAEECRKRILGRVQREHEVAPHRPGVFIDRLRPLIPGRRGPDLADRIVDDLERAGSISVRDGFVFTTGFYPSLSGEQEGVRKRILEVLMEAGLAPPPLEELAASAGRIQDVQEVLEFMKATGEVVGLDESFLLAKEVAEEVQARVRDGLGGRSGLGPSDFRELIPVTRKHLLPILLYLDRMGVTVRRESGDRDVPGRR